MPQTKLKVCCSLGALDRVAAETLRQAGVMRSHHSIETSRAHSAICTSYTYEERLATIRVAKAAGLEVCSGGGLGMNESWQDRLDIYSVVCSEKGCFNEGDLYYWDDDRYW